MDDSDIIFRIAHTSWGKVTSMAARFIDVGSTLENSYWLHRRDKSILVSPGGSVHCSSTLKRQVYLKNISATSKMYSVLML